MIKCKHCDKEISTIVTSFFDHEGSDYERELPFYVQDNAIVVSTNKTWTGHELSEEEQIDTIKCPHCRKFPFEPEIQVEEVVEIIMFTGE